MILIVKSPIALPTCLILLAALSGCGQTGPLYMPNQAMRHGHKVAGAPPKPATATSTAATPSLSASTPSATTAATTGAATSEGAATTGAENTSTSAPTNAPMVQMSPPSPAAGLAAPMANSNANSGEAINQTPTTQQSQPQPTQQ